MKSISKQKLGAINSLAKSKMFVVITDQEAIVAADFSKGFESILMVSAIKQIQTKLQSILDGIVGAPKKAKPKPTAKA